MNDLQQYTNGKFNLPVGKLPDGSIEFDAEKSAIGLGICHKREITMFDGNGIFLPTGQNYLYQYFKGD